MVELTTGERELGELNDVFRAYVADEDLTLRNATKQTE